MIMNPEKTMQKQRRSVLILICLIFPFLLTAEEANINWNIPELSSAPKIDGKLDNPLWETEALKIEDFVQFTPVEKGTPTQKTVAYLGYDKKNLYIAFQCFDTEPDKIRASITQRDNIMEDDWVLIFLDAFNEKRRAYAFMLNPFGIQMDAMRLEEGGNDNMDDSWDAVFYSDGKINSQGYTVEMALPFKSIRFPDSREKVWGLTLGRTVARNGEIIIWPPMSKSRPGLLCQEEEIRISGQVEKGKNIEIMPIFTSLKTKSNDINPQPGLNFKYGISSDITLDMTVNPDFSQIEADTPQIDMNKRFALYYPEKRPFFLEGMEIFRFPEIQMVYTRRIIDPVAGAKLTGKTGRFTYGFLSAMDGNPTESLWSIQGGDASPAQQALFNVFRVKADVFKESYLGFSLTDKEMNGDYNRVAGIDGQFKFKQNFFLSFQAMGSQTRSGDRQSNLAPALYGQFGYYSRNWGGGLYWLSLHPDFVAASGFVNRVDYRSIGGSVYYQFYPEKQYLNQVRIRLMGGRRFTHDGETLEDEWVALSSQLRFTEFSQMNIKLQRDMERYGGVDFQKTSLEVDTSLLLISWLPFGLAFRTGDSIYYDPDDPFLGYGHSYGLFFTLKPSKRLRMSTIFSKETFWKRWGEEQVYDFNVLRQQTTYQISKTLSLRTIIDYNHFSRKIYGSFLFSYVLKPGTVFFLGLDNNMQQNSTGRYFQDDYSVFLKFSYWLRI
jgi:hypothetical protein